VVSPVGHNAEEHSYKRASRSWLERLRADEHHGMVL